MADKTISDESINQQPNLPSLHSFNGYLPFNFDKEGEGNKTWMVGVS